MLLTKLSVRKEEVWYWYTIQQRMFVQGTREWFGENAKIFLQIRNIIETTLLEKGFNYFCGGLVSKRTLYESNVDSLGEKFFYLCG